MLSEHLLDSSTSRKVSAPAHLRKGSSMATTEDTTNFDHQLTDQERFQVGGRDTVLLVWSLIAAIAIGFLLLVH